MEKATFLILYDISDRRSKHERHNEQIRTHCYCTELNGKNGKRLHLGRISVSRSHVIYM